MDGYLSDVDGYDIINTITGTTEVSGTKTWNVPEGTELPESITVNLYRNNEWIDSKEVTAEEDWSYSWTDLAAYSEDGKTAYTYTVDETEMDGYLSDVDGYDIINTITGTTEVSGTKTWNVPEGTELPESITVNLYRNNEWIDSKEVTAEEDWSYSWTDLAAYSEDGKTAYTYTVDETEMDGYLSDVDGYDIINTITGTTEVSGTKTWNVPEGTELPESITVNLYRNNEWIDSKEVTAEEDWSYSWTDLAAYSEDGKTAYTYTVDEEPVAGYNKTIDGYDITNIRSDKIIVEGEKTWNVPEGTELPESITVNLYQNGDKIDSKKVTAEDDWKYSWTDLAAYSEDGKTAYLYTVDEEAVEGYEKAVSVYNIVNTITGTTEVSGTKTWNVPEGTELPEGITVNLYQNGEQIDSKEVTAKDNWKYSWTDLELYSEDGKTAYTYTVDENPIDGYISTVKDYDITNTITSVKINKVDIADGKLVEGAYLQILDQDGNVVDEWVSTKESHEVTGLMTGETYTLHEMTAPDGYDLTEDTTFVLKEDGTIDADKTTAASKDGVLLVEDTKTEQTDKAIEVTKKLGTIFGNTLSAEDATYYVALYADEACTKRISNVKALEFKNASSSTVTFENLKEDTTYYVGECTADGTSYKAGTTEDGVRYTVNFGDGNRVTIEKADGTKEVHFDNVFLTIPDGYNVDASLKIVKKVVDVDGNAKETNETFYAGLFADKECTTLSDAVSKNIIELNMNGSAETNVEITVPLYPAGTVVNLYVAEVDKDGNLVTNDDKFAYDVEVTNGEVTLDAQNDTAEVTITNSETSEEESESESETESESESETETEKQTETESETESKGKKPTKQTTTAAKTGDNTPIGALAGALAVSAAVIVVYIRRRRKNEE